jgi:hypothetical protein
MTRGQRRAHFRIWLAMALALPLMLAAILALAPSPTYERAPVRLDDGGGG